MNSTTKYHIIFNVILGTPYIYLIVKSGSDQIRFFIPKTQPEWYPKFKQKTPCSGLGSSEHSLELSSLGMNFCHQVSHTRTTHQISASMDRYDMIFTIVQVIVIMIKNNGVPIIHRNVTKHPKCLHYSKCLEMGLDSQMPRNSSKNAQNTSKILETPINSPQGPKCSEISQGI